MHSPLQLSREHNGKPRCCSRCSHVGGWPLKQVSLISTPWCLWNLLTAEYATVRLAVNVVARQCMSLPAGGWCRTTLSECAGHLCTKRAAVQRIWARVHWSMQCNRLLPERAEMLLFIRHNIKFEWCTRNELEELLFTVTRSYDVIDVLVTFL